MNAFCVDKTKQCANVRHVLPLTKRQTDRHDKAETLSSMSLSNDRDEMLPPSRRASLEITSAR